MTTLLPIRLKCPCCGEEFESVSWGSTNTFGPLTTELYRQAGGFPSMPLDVHGCGKCGYCGYKPDFAEGRVDATLRQWVKENLANPPGGQEMPPSRKYEHTARIAVQRGETAVRLGQLWLRAAWCGDHEGQSDRLKYRREAARCFEEALEQGKVTNEERPFIIYLAGELNRRLGNAEKAKAWFAKLPNAVGKNERLAWLVDLAIQQSTDPKEYVKERPEP